MTLTIYHNPRCRKSREALTYLEKNGHQPTVVDYQKERLTEKEIQTLLAELGYTAEALVRKNEALWKSDFKGKSLTEKELISALTEYPKLIERPIISNGNQAVIARPLEKLITFLK